MNAENFRHSLVNQVEWRRNYYLSDEVVTVRVLVLETHAVDCLMLINSMLCAFLFSNEAAIVRVSIQLFRFISFYIDVMLILFSYVL